MRKALSRRLALVPTIILAMALSLCAYRIVAVNASVLPHERIAYSLGEAAMLPAYQKLEVQPYDSGVRLVAHGVIIADDEYITRYYPSYAQAVKSQRGYSEELKWVIVELEVCNATDGDIKASLVNLHAQTGAWTNGVDMLLFADMNEGSGTILSLGLGEEKQLWVPFLLSKGQFGYRDDWYRIDEKEYELVLATYPDKVYISLGKPDKAGSNNPRTYNGQSTDAAFSLQEEGQVG